MPERLKTLIEDLYYSTRAFVSDDFDDALAYVDDELPLNIHEYPSGMTIWDSWVVPRKWTVEHAYIETTDGERILDVAEHPLHVITYSDSFEGKISRETLLEHLHTHPDIPEAIPYHFRQNYRPWDSEWGFCASQEFVESLNDDEYDVSIDTTFNEGTMKVGEHTVEGENDETVAFIAHVDHVGMANDDLSGVAAGVEVMQRLDERDDLTYTYKLLLVPEMIGSAAYLSTNRKTARDFEYGIFLETLGNDNRVMLQHSMFDDSRIDRVAEHVLRRRYDEFEVCGFREKAGDDELIYEGPGFEIPTLSVSRYPYPEYHTNLDDPDIITEEHLVDGVEYVEEVVNVLERDFVPNRQFEGIPSLANPKYDLYIDPGQPGLSDSNVANKNIRAFRDYIFRYLDGNYTVFDIATEFDLTFDYVHDYLRAFKEKGLVETTPAVGEGCGHDGPPRWES
jgi:aminopeptidase-like protein